MGSINQKSIESQLQKLKEDNKSLSKRLSDLKKERLSLERTIRDRNILINSLPSGMILIQGGKILEINKLLLKELEFDVADNIAGHSLMDLITPDQKVYMRSLLRSWNSGKVISGQYELNLVTHGGKIIPYDVNVNPIRFKNRKSFLLNLTNIEKRKEKEKDNIRQKKKDALDRMVSGLTGRLLSFHNQLLKKIEKIKSDPFYEKEHPDSVLTELEKAAHEILSMVGEFEILSIPEKFKSKLSPCYINDVVKMAISFAHDILGEAFERHGKSIDLKSYLRSSSIVEGDPKLIKDAILYIITNAVEAISEQGEILISTEDNIGMVHIYIQDDGRGIPSKIMEDLFDPFFTTKPGNRAGLGLSISLGIIGVHGGDIDVLSREGQGAVFEIRLPIAIPPPKPRPRFEMKMIKDARILIVQQDDVVRELLSHQLRIRGCRVNTSGTGLEGLGKLKKKKFDLTIADADSLHITCSDYLNKCHKINSKMPVILILNNNVDELSDRYKGWPSNLKLVKPFEVNKAVKQISDVLISKNSIS